MKIIVSIAIACPVESVFAFVSDYTRDPAWWAGVIEMSQTPAGRSRVGTHTGGGSLLWADSDDPDRGHEIRARPSNRLRGSDGENDPRLRKPDGRGGEWTGVLHVSGNRRGAWFSGAAFPTAGTDFAQAFSRRSPTLKSAAGGSLPHVPFLRRGAALEGPALRKRPRIRKID
jgi:hypothetical protein